MSINELLAARWVPSALRKRSVDRLRDAQYREELAAATASKDPNAVAIVRQARAAQEYFDYEEAEIEYTRQLLAEAHKYHALLPEYPPAHDENDSWSFSSSLGTRYLTRKGVNEVRQSIRGEQRWRIERRAHLLQWLSGITGVVGALIGLVSLLLRK